MPIRDVMPIDLIGPHPTSLTRDPEIAFLLQASGCLIVTSCGGKQWIYLAKHVGTHGECFLFDLCSHSVSISSSQTGQKLSRDLEMGRVCNLV